MKRFSRIAVAVPLFLATVTAFGHEVPVGSTPEENRAWFEGSYQAYKRKALWSARKMDARQPRPVASAAPFALDAIRHAEAAFGAKSPYVRELWLDIADAYTMAGKTEKSLRILDQLLLNQRLQFGDRAPELIPIFVAMGKAYWRYEQRNVKAGLHAFRSAFEVAKIHFGENSKEVATLWLERGKLVPSLDLRRETKVSLERANKLARQYRKEDPRFYIEILLGIGDGYMDAGFVKSAYENYVKAIKWQQKSTPANDDLIPLAQGNAAQAAILLGWLGNASAHFSILQDYLTSARPTEDFHAYFLARSGPHYPREAREQEIVGEVQVRYSVDPIGRTTDITIEESAHPLLDQAAIECVGTWIFMPAARDGRFVRQDGLQVRLEFRLAD